MRALGAVWIWAWLSIAILLCLIAEAFVYLAQLFRPGEADRIFKGIMGEEE